MELNVDRKVRKCQPLRVGLCLARSKREKLKLPSSIFQLCQDNSIEIIDIDLDAPLDAQGPFDIILHKILEFRGEDKEKGEFYKDKFIHYISNHKMRLIDPISTCELLTNRFQTMDAVTRCEFSSRIGKRVFVPKFYYLEDLKDNLASTEKMISSSGLVYPIIVKHFMAASFGKVAHEMSIIFGPEGLNDIKTPCFLQQFHNHDGYMVKIYTVGTKFYLCKRPSIKDLFPGNYPTIHFHSGNISKRGKQSPLHSSGSGETNVVNNDPTLLEEDVVNELLQRLNKEFEFTLLGIDVIIDKDTGNYGIIDINYFPGYDGVKELFQKDLVHLLLETGKSSQNFQSSH